MVPVAKGYIIAVHRVRRKIGPIITIITIIIFTYLPHRFLTLPDENLIANQQIEAKEAVMKAGKSILNCLLD